MARQDIEITSSFLKRWQAAVAEVNRSYFCNPQSAIFNQLACTLDLGALPCYTQLANPTPSEASRLGRTTMRCRSCNTPNAPENKHCEKCGHELPPPPASLLVEDAEPSPPAAEAVATRPARPRVRRRVTEEERYDDEYQGGRHRGGEADDVVSTIIPYRNPTALAAYYCGIFSLIPVLGLVLALVAIVLGIIGVRYRQLHPKAKGTAHAIVGIVFGVLALPYQPLICYLLWITYR
jgi:hypothetical protein